jgi:hypothetical protein
MKDLSPNHQFLSISVEQCLNRLFLQQMQYVLDILECVCMTSASLVSCLWTLGQCLIRHCAPISDLTVYWCLARTLQYLTFTKLDISYIVQQVYLHA